MPDWTQAVLECPFPLFHRPGIRDFGALISMSDSFQAFDISNLASACFPERGWPFRESDDDLSKDVDDGE